MADLLIAPSLSWPDYSWRGTNFINGVHSADGHGRAVHSPYNNEKLGELFEATGREIERTVAAARQASAAWMRVPIKERSAHLFAFRSALLREIDQVSRFAALESGKTFAEARAEVLKAIEVLEFATSLQNSDSGGLMEVSRGVTCEYRREALGVTVGITPFNFPAMVPMWMIPVSLALGNSFILKPSDKVPFTPTIIASLISEAGFPAGVFSVLQGGRSVVEGLASSPDIAAIGFVGSSPVARHVYALATNTGKRALCLGGAKNHLIVTPDADRQLAIEGILASFTGCAGQRCMAASVLVAVGDVEDIIDGVVEAARKMKLGADMGALIDRAAVDRLSKAVNRAIEEGASVRLDGRGVTAPAKCEAGNWFGPTVIDRVTPDMECSCTELFGPLLSIIRVGSIDEALELERTVEFGNALSVFTSSGHVARYVADRATSGMVGINIGVPVPREPFSFGGTKASKFGAGDITGVGGVEFWSSRKKITVKWAPQSDKTWMS